MDIHDFLLIKSRILRLEKLGKDIPMTFLGSRPIVFFLPLQQPLEAEREIHDELYHGHDGDPTEQTRISKNYVSLNYSQNQMDSENLKLKTNLSIPPMAES